MSDIEGIIEIVFIERREGTTIERHFPIKKHDTVVCKIHEQLRQGDEFPMGGGLTVVGMDRLTGIDLELTASIRNDISDTDSPPVMWYSMLGGMNDG